MIEMDEFYLLPPQLLPLNTEEMSNAGNYTNKLETLIKLDSVSRDRLFLKTTKQVLKELIPCIDDIEIINDDITESAQNKDNDVTFNIIRVKANRMDMLSYSSIKAFSGVLNDVINAGTSLNSIEWGILHEAYMMLFRFYANPQADIKILLAERIPAKPEKNAEINPHAAYLRWVNGHYMFMTIIQGMIINLNCFHAEMGAANVASANAHLLAAGLLMQSSAVALKYAGDYTHDKYLKSVRPTLMPPVARPELSGLYWRDHEYLIKNILKKLNPLFTDPPALIADALKELKKSFANAYDAHKYVCGKFVGTEEKSLISKKPAVEVLGQFKHSRLRMLEGEKRD